MFDVYRGFSDARCASGWLSAATTESSGQRAGVPPRPHTRVDDPSGFAIRVPTVGRRVVCGGCGMALLAAGPTGFVGRDPVCDLCFLRATQPLGMVLALVAVARAFANADQGEHTIALTELGAFARIYERLARAYGPPRRFETPDPLAGFGDE